MAFLKAREILLRLPVESLMRKIHRLLRIVVINQPEAILFAAFPNFVVVHFPVENKGAAPFQSGSHDLTCSGVLLLRRDPMCGKAVFADKHTLAGDPWFRRKIGLKVV